MSMNLKKDFKIEQVFLYDFQKVSKDIYIIKYFYKYINKLEV